MTEGRITSKVSAHRRLPERKIVQLDEFSDRYFRTEMRKYVDFDRFRARFLVVESIGI